MMGEKHVKWDIAHGWDFGKFDPDDGFLRDLRQIISICKDLQDAYQLYYL